MSDRVDLFQMAAELKRVFDQSFAAPLPEPSAAPVSLLLIRVGTGEYALKTADLAGLEANCKIVPLPAEDPTLSGLAGIRGRLIPVYSLRALLGYESSRGPCSWLALCGQPETIGLAIDELDGHVYISPADLHAPDGQAPEQHVGEALVWDGTPRRVLSVQSILAAIARRVDQAPTPRETQVK